MMPDELNINKETIHQILHEDLGVRKSAQSSSHGDSRMGKGNGRSHHAKTSDLSRQSQLSSLQFSLS
jgi:hypothetical protein